MSHLNISNLANFTFDENYQATHDFLGEINNSPIVPGPNENQELNDVQHMNNIELPNQNQGLNDAQQMNSNQMANENQLEDVND